MCLVDVAVVFSLRSMRSSKLSGFLRASTLRPQQTCCDAGTIDEPGTNMMPGGSPYTLRARCKLVVRRREVFHSIFSPHFFRFFVVVIPFCAQFYDR